MVHEPSNIDLILVLLQGPYRIQNATFDMNVIQALPMPLEGHVYRVRHFMMEPHGVLHACSEMEIQFHRARN